MHRNFIFTVLILFLFFLIPPASRADDDGEQDARELFAQATDAFNNHDFVVAADLFRLAHQKKPTWKLMYNIGQAEAAAKRYGFALEAFESFLSEGGDRVAKARNEEVISEINRLRILVGTIKIEAPDDTEILINGILRGKTPFVSVVRVAVGKQKIQLVRGGAELFNDDVKVIGGEETTVSGMVKSEDTQREDVRQTDGFPEKDTAQRSSGGQSTSPLKEIGWTTLGVGTATVVGGAILGAAAMSKEKDLSKDCPNQVCTDAKYDDDKDKTKTIANMSTALFVAGGTLAATGIVLLVVAKKKQKASRAISAIPVLNPGFLGLQLEGRF